MKLEHITKIYTSKKGIKTKALDDVSLSLPSKGLIFLTGKSGAGKTTLIELISGLNTDYKGNIDYHGTSLKELSSSQLDAYRNSEIGFIFQNYALFEDKTVFENLEFVLRMNQRTDIKKIDEVLSSIGLLSHKDKYPHELSGGEQQRVAIARALLKNPSVIIADEPTAALDEENAILVFDFLKQIASSKLVLVVCHHEELIQKYADGVILLDEGKIKEASLPSSKEDSFPLACKPTHCSFRFILSLIAREFHQRLKSVLLPLLICLFSILIFGFSFTIATTNKIDLIQETMKKNNAMNLTVYKEDKTNPEAILQLSDVWESPILEIKNHPQESIETNISKQIFQGDQELYTTDFCGLLDTTSLPSSHSLTYGKWPEKENEVAISSYMYSAFQSLGCLDNIKINTYEDIPKIELEIGKVKLKIVGILDTKLDLNKYKERLKQGNKAYEMVMQEISALAMSIHTSLYTLSSTITNIGASDCTALLLQFSKDKPLTKELIQYLKTNQFYFDNEAITIVNQIYETFYIIKNILLWVSIVLLIFVGLYIYKYTFETMDKEKKDIAIYKSIGLSTKDTTKIYLIKAIISSIIVSGISIGCSIPIVLLINKLFNQFMAIEISFLLWTLPSICLQVIFPLVIFIGSLIYPLFKYNYKYTPIEILKVGK